MQAATVFMAIVERNEASFSESVLGCVIYF